jgi:hypothetical protein
MNARALAGALLAALGVALACATLDQPQKNGYSLDDGVAPYRRAERVELCFGPTRVVEQAPSASDQGVCASGGAKQSCSTHETCGDREACICGRCTVQLCRFSRDCRPGLVCAGTTPRRCTRRCESDVDCPLGIGCLDGLCMAACAESSDCAAGELCLSGVCKVVACGPGGASCVPGSSCDLQLREGTLHAPSAIADGARTILYFELREAGTALVLRAESSDGVRFVAVPEMPVIAPAAGQTRVETPSAVAFAGGVDLYYTVDDSSIHRARSSNGIDFSPGELVLAAEADWEAGRVASPGPIQIGPTLLLFYEGGAGAGIGLAISTDGGARFERSGSQPLLRAAELASARWTLLEGIGGPSPIVAQDPSGASFLRLFLHARGREDTAPNTAEGGPAKLNDSIAVAVARLPLSGAPVLAQWPHNPVLGGIENLVPIEEREPTVIRSGGEWRMVYESDGRLQMATNPPR